MPDAPENGGNDAQGAPTPPAEKTFPESVVNQMIEDRLARERRKFADYGEVKSEAERLREQVADVDTLRKRAERAEAERDAIREGATMERRTRALVLEAVRAGARNPELVAGLVPSDAVTLADDGTVKGADRAIARLVETDAYLFAAPAPAGGDGGARQSSPVRKEGEMNALLRRAAGV